MPKQCISENSWDGTPSTSEQVPHDAINACLQPYLKLKARSLALKLQAGSRAGCDVFGTLTMRWRNDVQQASQTQTANI